MSDVEFSTQELVQEKLGIPELPDVELDEGGFLGHLRESGKKEKDLLEECQMPQQKRLEILSERREKKEDAQMVQGIEIAKKIASADETDRIVLSEDESQALGIDYRDDGHTREEILKAVGGRIKNLTSGRLTVIRPAARPSEDEGRRRREGVDQLVTMQTMVAETARLAIERGDLKRSINTLSEYSGLGLANAPSWCLNPLVEAVCGADLSERKNLERTADLVKALRKQLANGEGKAALAAENVDNLSSVARMYRAAHKAEEKLWAIRVQEREKEKAQLHVERMRTVEPDTYTMTEELGREWVKGWLEMPKKWLQFSDYYLRHAERGENMNLRLKMLFNQCEGFHEKALKAIGNEKITDPEVFLKVISVLNQDPEVFQEATAVLAEYEAKQGWDWGGYRLNDYKGQKDQWDKYWANVLRWQLNGLALGAMKEAGVSDFTSEIGEKMGEFGRPWRGEQFGQKKIAIMTAAMEALWGDGAARVGDLDYVRSNFTRDQKAALQRFSNWINGFDEKSGPWQVAEKAVVKVGENVKERKRQARRQAEQEAKQIANLEARFEQDSRLLERKLAELEKTGDEKYPEALTRLEVFSKLQAELTPADSLVEIVGTGQGEELGLKVSYKEAFDKKRLRLEKELANLEPDKNKADKRERYLTVRRQLAEVQAQLEFINETGRKLKGYNEGRSYRKPKTMARKRMMWMPFEYLPMHGEMTQTKFQKLQEAMAEFSGEAGLLSVQRQEFEALRQTFTEAGTFEAKEEVRKQMLALEKENAHQLKEAKEKVDKAFKKGDEGVLNFTVVKWVKESLRPWLKGDKRLF